ncbi:endonuclease [Actinacidiphila glaucinigra]|uniref:endonuclease n=1 Tax=Actinacidiphila glaucinigra TaxID=235986 RepID=UPI0037CBA1BA
MAGTTGHRDTTKDKATVKALLDSEGHTYAEDAGIKLRNTPQPLYQALVAACLLSARIKASVATDAAHELFAAGMRDPRRMRDATWQQRVDALGRGHYRRYDERTATQLGDGAELLLDRYGGDLRRLRDEADGDPDEIRRALRQVPGLGPVGVEIFLREVQAVWPETGPLFDGKALQGAERLGLPARPEELAALVPKAAYAVFAAALVRAALERRVVEEVAEAQA